MSNEMSPDDVEFMDPNRNFLIVMAELRQRIQRLQLDILHITDEELKGFAMKIYTELRLEYFDMMYKDLRLQQIYSEQEEDDEENYD